MSKIYTIITLIFLSLLLCCKVDNSSPISVLEQIKKAEVIFNIDNKRDTIIEGKEGTLIFVEKESFQDTDGNLIEDSIQISLKEVYKIEDILIEKISTTANGKLLETGGMINLKAFANGKDLKLINEKEIVVHFPKKDVTKEMNLFYGKKDSIGTLEWELEKLSGYRLDNRIQVWYTKYKFLDDSTLYLADGRNYWYMIDNHFGFNDKEIKSLVNKTVDAKYIIYENGDLEFIKLKECVTNSLLSALSGDLS